MLIKALVNRVTGHGSPLIGKLVNCPGDFETAARRHECRRSTLKRAPRCDSSWHVFGNEDSGTWQRYEDTGNRGLGAVGAP